MTVEPDLPYNSIEPIVDDLRPFDGVYKRAAIDAAIDDGLLPSVEVLVGCLDAAILDALKRD